MAELILKSNGKADETIHLQDKIQIKEILHEADWDSLTSIMIVHNVFNTLSFTKRNDDGTFRLLLNGKVYEDPTVYSNKNTIVDSFLMFIMEKNRYKISRPFELIEQKKTPRQRDKNSEYEYSNQEYDRPPGQEYDRSRDQDYAPTSEFDERDFEPERTPRQSPMKKIEDSGISFKGIWWILAIGFMIFRACSS